MIRSVLVALVVQTSLHPNHRAAESLSLYRGGARYDFMLPEGSSNIKTSFFASVRDQDKMTTMLPSLSKNNLNLPWVAATSLAVWFLFIHTPPFWAHRKLLARDSLLAIHIVAAGTIYMACAHNCLFTPSSSTVFGVRAKFRHEWIGRLGLMAGVVSFTLGAFLSWSRLGKVGEGGTTLGFALPITIGGILQLNSQYNGFIAIRRYKKLSQDIRALTNGGKNDRTSNEQQPQRANELEDLQVEQRKALRLHIGHMIGLFVSACGIPAGIRLAELATGRKDGMATTIAIFSVIGVLNMIANRYMRMMKPNLLERSK
jgi:hypothetical protein